MAGTACMPCMQGERLSKANLCSCILKTRVPSPMVCVSGTGKPLGSSPAFTRTFWSLSGGHHGRGAALRHALPAKILWSKECLGSTHNLLRCKAELDQQILERGRCPKGMHPNDGSPRADILGPAQRRGLFHRHPSRHFWR